jgi:hypothetical protein
MQPQANGVRAPAGAHTISERIDPAEEDRYWRENFRARPYVPHGSDYSRYRPAFRFGWESRVRYFDRSWHQAESHLQRDWLLRHESAMPWLRARLPARDAWERVDGR